MFQNFGTWDYILMVVVSIQSLIVAYLAKPTWKVILVALPFPFTATMMAVGRPIGDSNLIGLLLYFIYVQFVRIFYSRWKMPIIPSIIISVIIYCSLGVALLRILPESQVSFWILSGLIWIFGVILLRHTTFKIEQEYKSPLPVYIKLPVVVGIVFVLILIKGILQGFTTLFPLVSIIAAYETRHSLWTFGSQVPVMILSMVPMMGGIRISQYQLGLGPSLLVGWILYLLVFIPLTLWFISKYQEKKLEYNKYP